MFQVRPLSVLRVTSPYGDRDLDGDDSIIDAIEDAFDDDDEFHGGTDYAAAEGTPVFALGNGVVAAAGAGVGGSAGGNAVVIDDDDEGRYFLLHLSRVLVSAGQRVRAGQRVGLSGKTGVVTGPHLHFEWQPNFPSRTTADPDPRLQQLRAPSSSTTPSSGGGIGGVALLLLPVLPSLLRRRR